MSGNFRPHGLPGVFIALEGGDGAGKTTQRDLLQAWATNAGHPAVATREPGGTTLGKTLRRELLHGEDINDRTEALLFAADRAHHVHSLIRPALADGALVITDRYIDSSIAYQGTARRLGNEIRDLSLWATGGLLPDLTIVLDLPPAHALTRRKDAPDRMEREARAFHDAVRIRFLTLAAQEAERYLVLDATLPAEELHKQITSELTTRYPRLPGLATLSS